MAEPNQIVLYVEDEESDRLLMQWGFQKQGMEAMLRMVKDGQEALDYLSGAAAYTEREKHPLPGVVLLDLNLPEVHGFEVLEWIRAHPLHRELPVVIFSSSSREEDRAKARLLGANEFIPKPSSGLQFAEVARTVHSRWVKNGDYAP